MPRNCRSSPTLHSRQESTGIRWAAEPCPVAKQERRPAEPAPLPAGRQPRQRHLEPDTKVRRDPRRKPPRDRIQAGIGRRPRRRSLALPQWPQPLRSTRRGRRIRVRRRATLRRYPDRTRWRWPRMSRRRRRRPCLRQERQRDGGCRIRRRCGRRPKTKRSRRMLPRPDGQTDLRVERQPRRRPLSRRRRECPVKNRQRLRRRPAARARLRRDRPPVSRNRRRAAGFGRWRCGSYPGSCV